MSKATRVSRPTDSRVERQIITGMITSSRFLQTVLPLYRPEVFTTDFSRTIAAWCVDYWGQYEEAPGKQIQDLFLVHSKDLEPGVSELIGEFLTSVSKEYETQENFNDKYYLNRAEEYFRLRGLENIRDQLNACIIQGSIEDGESLISGYVRPSSPEIRGIDVFGDSAAIARAFDPDSGETMFSLPGELGRMLPPFERGGVWGILGATKRGKSWWLQEIALAGYFHGFNVLFISMEMTEPQMLRRIHMNVAGRPKSRVSPLLIPLFDCWWNQIDDCNLSTRACRVRLRDVEDRKPKWADSPVGYIPCSACRKTREWRPATWWRELNREPLMGNAGDAIRKGRAILRSRGRGKIFKFVDYPDGYLTIPMLKTILSNYEYYENFLPDLIVTDYADKMRAVEDGDPRHKIYEIWRGHKNIAQERNCLVVTASQSNTIRTGKDAGVGSFDEDIRKAQLLDGGAAINQTDIEYTEGIMRVAPIGIRHDEARKKDEALVLYNYGIGRAILDSHWIRY